MKAGWWLVVASTLLLAVPSALAADGTLHAEARLPIQIDGNHQVQADDASFRIAGDDGWLRMHASGDGTLTRVVERAFGYTTPDDPRAGVQWFHKSERHGLPLDGARITLDERRDMFQLLAYDGQLTLQGEQTPLLVGALGQDIQVTNHPDDPEGISVRFFGERDPFHHGVDSGLLQSQSETGRLAAQETMVFVENAVLTYDRDGETQTIQAHFRVEERDGAIYDPVNNRWFGEGSHTEYISEYLLLDLQEGSFETSYGGTPARLYSTSTETQVEGTTTLADTHGRLTIREEDGATVHNIDGQELRLDGLYTLLVSPEGPTHANIDGEGDFTQVQYGSVAAQYDWSTTLAAFGMGTLLLVAALVVWTQGKAVLASLGGVAGYARVHGEAILNHAGRRQIYDLVKNNPGSHFMELSDNVDFGGSSLNYHLRVLEKNELILRIKDGRYVRFFDKKSGLYANGRKQVVAALKNDKTAEIARFIRDNPGIAQCDVAHRFGIAASTVSWHIRRLAEAQLVEKQKDNHFIRYYLGDGWSKLPQQERANYGLAS